MSRFRWRQSLGKRKFKLWLLLPLIGLMFLIGTDWITNRVLTHAYATMAQLQSDEQLQVELLLRATIVAIEAEIDRQEKVTEVTVRTGNSIFKELELDIPVTEFAEVEEALAKELGLSREAVKRLTRYRIGR